MARLRYNGLSTTLGASLSSSATAVTFAAALTHSGGTAVPTIGSGDYIPLSILDSTGKLSEVVYLTAYTAGATTGTITRGQEGTTGVAHASGDKAIHGPTVADYVATADTPPATPNAKDDEFNDGSGMSGTTNGLASKWSKRNLATASWLQLDTNASKLGIYLPAGQAQDQVLYQTVPAGDFRLTAAVSLLLDPASSLRLMFGLLAVDASGNGVAVGADNGNLAGGVTNSGPAIRNVSAWVQASPSVDLPPHSGSAFSQMQKVYLSLRKSGTTYYGAAWDDPKVLPEQVREISITPTGFTPAFVGVGQIFQSVNTPQRAYLLDWFRVS